jgi:hypothetical protein
LLLGIFVLAIVGIALACNTNARFSGGSLFCCDTCVPGCRIAFRIDPSGSDRSPCGVNHPVYYIDGNNKCALTASGTTKFVPTANQGK